MRPMHSAILMLVGVTACNRAESAGKRRAVRGARAGWTAGNAGGGRSRPIGYRGGCHPRHRSDRGDAVDRAAARRRGPDGRRSWSAKARRSPGARRCSRSTTPSSRPQVAQIEAERDLARQSLTRTRDLLSQKASSQSELERAEATMRSNEAQLELLKVRLDRTWSGRRSPV